MLRRGCRGSAQARGTIQYIKRFESPDESDCQKISLGINIDPNHGETPWTWNTANATKTSAKKSALS